MRGDRVKRATGELLAWTGGVRREALADLVSALSRLGEPALAEEIAPLAVHDDPEVRLAVAQGLDELAAASPATVAALVALSRDAVDEVRSWATFALSGDHLAGLGGVADALAARLEDPSEEIRVEAVRGLARRGDARAIDAALDLAPQWSRNPIFRDAVDRKSVV